MEPVASTMDANETRGASPDKATRDISKLIVFLLAIRPLLNLLRGDSWLFELGTYKVSVLSVWSIVLIGTTARRLWREPAVPPDIKRSVQGFFFIVFVLGVPRMLLPEALIKDVLMYTLFFLVALSAKGVIEDLGFDYVVRRFTVSALLLVIVHGTLGAAYGGVGDSDYSIGSYLGLFDDKHLAANSFFVTVPFLVCGALRSRKSLPLLLLFPTVLSILLTFQRTSLVSLGFFGLALVVFARRLSWLVPIALLIGIVLAATPAARMQEFVDAKIEEEVDAFSSGEVEAVGASRIGIALLAWSQFTDDSSPFEQLLGRGTAQAYKVSETILGTPVYAHMQLVELIVDYGVIGTALVLLFFVRIGRSKWRSFRARGSPEELVGLSMLVVIVTQLFFAMPLQDGTSALLAFWLFPALALSDGRRYDVRRVVGADHGSVAA